MSFLIRGRQKECKSKSEWCDWVPLGGWVYDDLVVLLFLFSHLLIFFSSLRIFLLIKLFRFFFFFCVAFDFIFLSSFLCIWFYSILLHFSLYFWFLIWLCLFICVCMSDIVSFLFICCTFLWKLDTFSSLNSAKVKVVDLPDMWATWLDSGHSFFSVSFKIQQKKMRVEDDNNNNDDDDDKEDNNGKNGIVYLVLHD